MFYFFAETHLYFFRFKKINILFLKPRHSFNYLLFIPAPNHIAKISRNMASSCTSVHNVPTVHSQYVGTAIRISQYSPPASNCLQQSSAEYLQTDCLGH